MIFQKARLRERSLDVMAYVRDEAKEQVAYTVRVVQENHLACQRIRA